MPGSWFCQHHGHGCNKFNHTGTCTNSFLSTCTQKIVSMLVTWKYNWMLAPCATKPLTFCYKKIKKSHMWNGRRIIFCTCFASGSVEPFPCINGAKHVLRGNTNPFGCAEIQLCANMSFAPHIEPSNLLVWNYNLHLQKIKPLMFMSEKRWRRKLLLILQFGGSLNMAVMNIQTCCSYLSTRMPFESAWIIWVGMMKD